MVSHDMLCDADFNAILGKADVPMMLIGDEVHNLGRPTFIQNPPDYFTSRLGLSATPVRQYDPEGTDALTQFFGDVVFQFTLADAIGVCLVPYDYFLHPVYLTDLEGQTYLELTQKIRKMGWQASDSNPDLHERIQRLQIRRRAVLEKAASKVDILRDLLTAAGPRRVHHTLVYASAKGREQLVQVNELLGRLNVHFHQLTAQETAQPALAKSLLDSFARGQLQVLTAMKVLDEGVNIPQIETAYILASSTVEREWVQRRGRVLRKCDEIGKKSATIHDFLVLPPLGSDDDTRGLLRAELGRAREFAALAQNAGAPQGPLAQVQSVINDYFS